MQLSRFFISLLSFWILVLNVTALPSSNEIITNDRKDRIAAVELPSVALIVAHKTGGKLPLADSGKKLIPAQVHFSNNHYSSFSAYKNICAGQFVSQQIMPAGLLRPLMILNCQYRK